MQDILARLRQEDRRREIVALALLLSFLGLVLLPVLFAPPANEMPRHLASNEQPRDMWRRN